MAMKLLKVEELPEVQRGIGAVSKPGVAITSVGQFRFTKAAAEVFGDKKHVVVGWDGDKRKLLFKGHDKPSKDAVSFENKPGKSGLYMSAAAVCKLLGYDYKAAGNQSYDAEVDEGKSEVSITVPEETPEPKPKRPRKSKAEKEAEKNGKTESDESGESEDESEDDGDIELE